MDLDALDRLLSAARERSGHSAFVIVGSPFDPAHGYFLNPVSPNLPTLPDGWEQRLLEIVLPSCVHAHFLDPNDAAVSNYARGDVRDREWLRAELAAGLLSIPVIDSRFRQTAFFDVAESRHARGQLEADEVWLVEGHSA